MTKSTLAEYRKKSGLTQQAVADAAGITLNRYQKYEYEILDISKATASTVLHIAQTLGVTAEELLQQKEPEA